MPELSGVHNKSFSNENSPINCNILLLLLEVHIFQSTSTAFDLR